jgi:phosphate-selective porin OprO/OprP
MISVYNATAAEPTGQAKRVALDQGLSSGDRPFESGQGERPAKPDSVSSARASDGSFSAESADSALKFKVKVFEDNASDFIDDNIPPNDTFVHRARATLKGVVSDSISYKLVPKFSDDTATLSDGYVDLKAALSTILRLGKFNSPLGLERLQLASNLHFMEHADFIEVMPSQEIGAQFLGSILEHKLSYAVAVTTGTPNTDDSLLTNLDTDFEYSARFFAEPTESSTVGVGGTVVDAQGSGNDFLPRFQPLIEESANAVAPSGEYLHWSPGAYYYGGPVGVVGEYSQYELEINHGAATNTRTNEVAQLTTVYVLTGEGASYTEVTPDQPVGSGGWGAWELAARYAMLEQDLTTFQLFDDPATEVSEAETWGVGVNWYMTANMKAVVDYLHTSFDGSAPSRGLQDDHVLLSRLQLSL